MQTPLTLGHGHFVIRLGKVVHTDEDITGFGQLLDRQLENLQLGIRRWQVVISNPPLRLEQGRHVGIVVDRQAIRIHCQHAFKRAVEAHDGLERQAVDQNNRNRLETIGPRCSDDVGSFFLGLNPVYRDLHPLVKVLNADAHPVETEFAQQGNCFGINFARINFNRILAAFQQLEVLAGFGHELAHFVVRQEGRRTAAPVQLNCLMRTIAFKAGTLQRQFLAEIL